ncbi:UNVERIFIED_CONTAM: hypothetical protein PYX00_002586 [Menopon gallinae]|uniref:Serpin domain-containing protein n=1 Tax=Menopon gallinae TaxID=328185 RepID=A0AAW2IHW1_9NEOP
MATTMAGKSQGGVSELSSGNLAFSKKLYGVLKEAAGVSGNIFYSPASLEVALALVYVGAKGSTGQEIARCLSLPESHERCCDAISACMSRWTTKSTDVTLNIANGLFVKKGFSLKQAYLDAARKYFYSLVNAVDFNSEEGLKAINDFVASATSGKIMNLFQRDSFDALTRVVLVNAIYFKGNWASQFKPENTFKGDFHLNEKETVKVDFMVQTNRFNVGFREELDASVVVLPYKASDLSMVLVIPNKIEGLSKVEERLSELDLVNIVRETYSEEIILRMPKFKITETLKLSNVLKRLGITEMFGDKADLSGIASEALFVSEVVQKTYIEVNEEGSEAAAATGVSMMVRCMPMPPRPLDVKSPFLFFVYDSCSELALFVGRLSNP